MAEKDEAAERKAKAARAKKLLAARRKERDGKVGAGTASTGGGSQRTSLSLDDAREEVKVEGETAKSGEDGEVEAGDKVMPEGQVVVDGVHSRAEESSEKGAADQDGQVAATPGKKKKKKVKSGAETTDTTQSEEPPAVPAPRSEPETTSNTSADHVDEALGPDSTPTGAGRGGTGEDHETIQKLKETISLLITERSELQAQLAALKWDLGAAQVDKGLLDEGRTLIARLEAEGAERERDLQTLQDRVGVLEGLEDEVQRLRVEAGGLRDERGALRDEIAGVRREVEDARGGEEERVGQLEKSLERSREREGGLESELGRQRTSNSELESELSSVREELAQIKAASADSTSSLTALQKTHDELTSRHATLQTRHTELQSQHQELRSQYDTLQSQHDATTSSHADLDAQMSKLRKDLDATTGRLDNMTKKADSAEKKRAALQEENGELVRQLEEVRGRVVQVMEEKVELAARLDGCESRAKVWERESEAQVEQIKSLRAQAQALAEDHEASSSATTDLQKKLDETTALLDSTRAELAAAQTRNAPAGSSDHTQGESIAALKTSHALEMSNHTSRIRSLENDLHASETKIHNLTRQLAQYPSTPTLADEKPRLMGIDALLPSHVRARRQVSLAALKARMEHARKAAPKEGIAPEGGTKVVQFGEEIVSCCPACEGELITL